jgi:hypothetical protein
MKHNDHIELQINEALNSLEGIERAKPRPFLYTRILASMAEEKSIWNRIATFIARPAVAFAGLIIILLLNAAALLNASDTNNNRANIDVAVADEYNPSAISSLYYYENDNAK